jgi:hypothetical protein
MVRPGPGVLASWTTIAKYFDCNVRTAKRWERERRLPVHRAPSGKRGYVFAYTQELDEWIRTKGGRSQCFEAGPEMFTFTRSACWIHRRRGHPGVNRRATGARFTANAVALAIVPEVVVGVGIARRRHSRRGCGNVVDS